MGVKHSYGAVGRGDTISFKPETLKVITDPKHPLFDPRVERPPSEKMVLSIMHLGIIEPLVIWRDGQDVYIVDGRQRRAAALEANKLRAKEGRELIECPCVWRRGDDAKLYEISISANEVRSGDSAIERAKKMQRLADFGRDEEQIAVVFGCTTATVRSSLALLECDVKVQRAVESGQVAATIATKLAKLPREEQVAKLGEMVVAGATKGAAAAKVVRGEKPTNGKLSAKDRKKVRLALLASSSAQAQLAAAALAYIEGDHRALMSWPPVQAVVEAALAAQKPKKQKVA